MNFETKLASIKTLKDTVPPQYRQLKPHAINNEFALKVFLYSRTLVLTKAAIRSRVPGGHDNLDISDERIVNNLPIKVGNDEFSAKTIADSLLEQSKPHAAGYLKFIKDVLIMSRLATNLPSISDVDCKFTQEILKLLNTRSDVHVFREFKIDDNLVIYFLNYEYLVLTHRGLVAHTDRNQLITPSATQEFFVSVFRLSSLLESYMSNGGFRGSKLKQLKIAKLSTYESTMRESKVCSPMAFNSRVGPNGLIHWFFNDGVATRRDRLTTDYIVADEKSHFSMSDDLWDRFRVEYGFPEFNYEFFESLIHKHKGNKRAAKL